MTTSTDILRTTIEGLTGIGRSLLPNLCDLAKSVSKGWSGTLWYIVANLGFKGWLVVILGTLTWIVFEVIVGGGKSANGFSWRLNVFVGSLTYAVLNTLLHFFFSWIFGDGIYCLVWPYPFHLATFWFTGWFLRWIGFWNH
ncbi:MAG: hypothetical protein Q7S09_02590 [bacterium]|nr:hypothetical protein [bacterium]